MDEKIERTEQDKEKFSAGNDTPAAQETEAPAKEETPAPETPQAGEPATEVKAEESPEQGENTPQPETTETPGEEAKAAEDTPLKLAEPVKKRKVVRKSFPRRAGNASGSALRPRRKGIRRALLCGPAPAHRTCRRHDLP